MYVKNIPAYSKHPINGSVISVKQKTLQEMSQIFPRKGHTEECIL